MNIFVLDSDPVVAAQYHCDKHVNKMLLEGVQILNTALHKTGRSDETFYRKTHANHPCCEWATSETNWHWLYRLVSALQDEFDKRYGGEHKSYSKAVANWGTPRDTEPEQFVLAMPNQYKSQDAVASYRRYYREVKFVLHRSTSLNRDTTYPVKSPNEWFAYSVDEPKWLYTPPTNTVI